MSQKFFTRVLLCAVGLQLLTAADARAADAPKLQSTPAKNAIPWNQIGAQAGAHYQGEALSVAATEAGARLRCDFQRMDGEATGDGLWLVSTVSNQPADRFRVMATAVGRQALAASGMVTVTGQSVRFTRAGLVEQYSVSMDGVRQDFLIDQPSPAAQRSAGGLIVSLSVSGAKVEPAPYGVQLVLAKSGRKLAYSRLRATDANGQELPARIQVAQNSEMAVVVNDAGAVYPVRIDPTFSDANWISLGGLDGAGAGYVFVTVMDGSGNLYIGGEFSAVGNALANNIAKWNGSTWSPLGLGMNGEVHALVVSGTNLYAGGYFTSAGEVTNANYVAQWNGSSWSALGSGIGPVTPYASTLVDALAVSGTNLYAGGNFSMAGGNAADGIALWNGSGWLPLGPGLGYVYSLAVSGTTLYAGGDFLYAGPILVNFIAQWNGSSWSTLDSGMSGPVSALAVSGANLYAGGSFTTAGAANAANVAEWNGRSWSALGSGVNAGVSALAVSGTNLYVGGDFTTAGGVTNVNYVAQWNGTNWSPLSSGMGGVIPASFVTSLVASGNTLYAGGEFATAGGSGANNIALWTGTNWSPLGSGFGGSNPFINAVAVSGSTLYVGGEFITGGANPANCIAQWNGSGWSALGSGMAGGSGENATAVDALAVSGTILYAGGYFTTAGGIAASSIAQWNGTNWSPLESGMGGASPYVYALAVSGSTLYAGGYFTSAGDDAGANNIAQWNGTSWSSLGSGMNSVVSALAVSGSTLYAGGVFTAAGDDTNANYIAAWDGKSWSSLDSGVNSSVSALAASGNTLYAAGYFTAVGAAATSANLVAEWNGSAWLPLGRGSAAIIPKYLLWLCPDPVYMSAAYSRMRAASWSITLRNGMAAVGRRWVRA